MDDLAKLLAGNEISGISLAYVGDAVWELFVRKYYVARSLNVRTLNRKVKALVNAKKQSALYRRMLPELAPQWREYGRKGKNANIKTYPRSCTQLEYREATAFEAVIASLYINGKTAMIGEIVKKFAEEETQ
ncbi:MAG: Mini-ribonuclease 3-like protein [Fusobacteriaceae bacterium]|jgi:ribonuclease-3 family protein|nr:Mini-ribonuclease 3-like protein [Fusobacteriaceae bacterium]